MKFFSKLRRKFHSFKKKVKLKIRKKKKRLKRKLIGIGKKHHWFMVLLRRAMYIRGTAKYKKVMTMPVNSKMVIFEAFMGRQYACSPKAIYAQMVNDPAFEDWTFVWAFKKPKPFRYLKDNHNTILVKYGSKKYLEYYSQAKYWVTNSRLKETIIKKPDQVYIQCWHGTPLKKLGYDITVEGNNAMNTKNDLLKKYKQDSDRYSYMISPSEFSTEKFASAFNIENKEIIKTLGYPRNDFLINYTQEDLLAIKTKLAIIELRKKNRLQEINNIKNGMGFDRTKKVILYAPTWRDNQHSAKTGYTYDLAVDFGKLKEKFGDEYIILFRAHYFISNNIDLSEYKGFVYDVSKYNDINELYVISDILITDYSSVFFDFANLRKPVVFYMYDFEEYKNEMRDFYIDLEELPGPIVQTEDELINVLENIDECKEKYSAVYKAFNDKFNYLDDGKASQRVIEECILSHQVEEQEDKEEQQEQ